VVAQFIYAGIAGLVGLWGLVGGIADEESALVVLGFFLLLVAGAGALAAWALLRCKRWAHIMGMFVAVPGLFARWPYLVGDVPDEMLLPFAFAVVLPFAFPVSLAILIFSFLQPVRDWLAPGSRSDCGPPSKHDAGG
jgi:hypothetical protein